MPKDKKNKTEKEKEVFELGEKEIVKESKVKTPLKKKGQEEYQEKLLKNILFGIALIVILVLGYYLYAQSQITMKYDGIEFKAASFGKGLVFYETQTLLPAGDGSKADFGFRIRTKPSDLKKVPFDSADDLNLMKINAMNFGNESFDCEGYGAIALPNTQRLFEKMGTTFVIDQNATCDAEGRYNLFTFKYGDKTQITNVGENCYEVTVKGNNDSCEILPATEKIMVEFFSKYKDFVEN